MLFLITAIAGTVGYFIYNYREDVIEYMFHRSVETYTRIRVTYEKIYNKMFSLVVDSKVDNNNNESRKINIDDIKIILEGGKIVNVLNIKKNESMNEIYSKMNWNECGINTYIHVCYTYQKKKYRIVFNYGQDLSILTTNTGWLDDGFYSGINNIENNLNEDPTDIIELMYRYSGPLIDFYDDVKVEQDAAGMLNKKMDKLLFNDENEMIKIYNILGEPRTIKIYNHKLRVI